MTSASTFSVVTLLALALMHYYNAQ